MNVTVLAAVGVVRRRTRKKIGQPERRRNRSDGEQREGPIEVHRAGRSAEQRDGEPDKRPRDQHPRRNLQGPEARHLRPRVVTRDRVAGRCAQAGGDREIVAAFSSSGDQPTRTSTATTPTASPAATRSPKLWPMKATAIAAVKSGVAAARSEVKPAGSVTVANEMSMNGTAENKAPTMRKLAAGRERRLACSVRRPAADAGAEQEPDLRRPCRADLG